MVSITKESTPINFSFSALPANPGRQCTSSDPLGHKPIFEIETFQPFSHLIIHESVAVVELHRIARVHDLTHRAWITSVIRVGGIVVPTRSGILVDPSTAVEVAIAAITIKLDHTVQWVTLPQHRHLSSHSLHNFSMLV